MQRILKAVCLLALGLFLYSRVLNDSLLYYINERFTALTMLASLGLVLVAGSTLVLLARGGGPAHDDPEHGRGRLSWAGFVLLALPVILGWLTPPAPLGASALSNRQLDIGGSSVGSVTVGGEARAAAPADGGPRNVLDWVRASQRGNGAEAIAGEEATVVGFVYRDERFADDQFLVARYVLSCCVADAAPIGLVVQWTEATALETDTWVEVQGHFTPGPFAGDSVAVLVADQVTGAERPAQPYLYP